jgi:DMSO/TMAO reductase YedYZ molybdopterin-dependent catalytic subunit
MHNQPGIIRVVIMGALVGVMMTAPLMAILYLADQVASLPLVVFDIFDWVGRTLPGDVITKIIDLMVQAITRFNLGETSSTAKTIEHLMAWSTFLGGGIVMGAVLFFVLRRWNIWLTGNRRLLPGLVAGVAMGLPSILIFLDVNFSAEAPKDVSVIWLALVFLVWGTGLSWAYYNLYAPPHEVAAAQPVTVQAVNRREFLIRAGGATAAITLVGAGLGRILEYQDDRAYQKLIAKRRAQSEAIVDKLPNADDPVKPAPGTRPEYTPLEDHYQIDINARPPELNENDWRLKISGLVDRPLTLTLDDIKNGYDPRNQYVTLSCISNPIGGDLVGTTRWTGVSLRDVLADAGLKEDARYIKITSVDGFYETTAIDLIQSDERIMLTYFWDGIPLLYKHGFPLRIYVPDLYGMKQPKWITEIEVMDHDEDGYWVVRGWDKVARMRATSVVDVVASDMTYEQDGQTLVPIGGIARAGARGISKVEVRIDDNDWVEAELRSPLSETTWVIWRYDWPFESGRHTFAVRCYEGDGTPQIAESNPTKPSGATGIDKLTRTL